MKRLAIAAAVLAVAAVMTGLVGSADEKKGNPEDISTIMKKTNGRGGLRGKLEVGLGKAKVDWAGLTKAAKEMADLGADLPKNTPPEGSAASWKKLSGGWAELTGKVKTAVESKDKAGATKALKMMKRTCGKCHKAHR